jgi:hypothetical protein
MMTVNTMNWHNSTEAAYSNTSYTEELRATTEFDFPVNAQLINDAVRLEIHALGVSHCAQA